MTCLLPSLLEMSPRQGQRPVDHDFLAQRRWHDVRQSREWSEDSLGRHPTQRLEEQLLSDQGNPATDHYPSRTKESDNLTNGLNKGISSGVDDPQGFPI